MKRIRLAPWVAVPPSVILGIDNLEEVKIGWPAPAAREFIDHLTGLYNRRAYEEALEAAIGEAVKQNAGFGLILFDLDHFKKVNDIYGHSSGDEVLTEFARRIKQSLRESDFPARLGGEEFAVLTTCYRKVFDIGERVRLAIGQAPFTCRTASIQITCSFGCSVYPVDGFTVNEVFDKADKALYQAKSGGRDRGVQWREN